MVETKDESQKMPRVTKSWPKRKKNISTSPALKVKAKFKEPLAFQSQRAELSLTLAHMILKSDSATKTQFWSHFRQNGLFTFWSWPCRSWPPRWSSCWWPPARRWTPRAARRSWPDPRSPRAGPNVACSGTGNSVKVRPGYFFRLLRKQRFKMHQSWEEEAKRGKNETRQFLRCFRKFPDFPSKNVAEKSGKSDQINIPISHQASSVLPNARETGRRVRDDSKLENKSYDIAVFAISFSLLVRRNFPGNFQAKNSLCGAYDAICQDL